MDLARLTKGVYLSDGFCRVQSIAVKKKHGQSTDLVMVLNEGRNRELRRILARVGHKVLRLKRIAVGPIKLADLPTGAWRRLMPSEIETLLKLAREKRRAAGSKRKSSSPGDASPKRSESVASEGAIPYLQKQALLAEPLSIDDLLRDDMDEGNLAEADLRETGGEMEHPDLDTGEFRPMTLDSDDDGQEFTDGPPIKRGGVIAYEADEPASPRVRAERLPGTRRKPSPNKPAPKGKRPFRKGQAKYQSDRPPREQPGERPRQNYGKKRPAGGKTAGQSELRPQAADQRRGRPAKAGGKQFAKPGGKKFGKPAAGGKKFGKPGGKKFGKPAGQMGGKSFGKPGGKRKGRR
jgi:hypothetical protein